MPGQDADAVNYPRESLVELASGELVILMMARM